MTRIDQNSFHSMLKNDSFVPTRSVSTRGKTVVSLKIESFVVSMPAVHVIKI